MRLNDVLVMDFACKWHFKFGSGATQVPRLAARAGDMDLVYVEVGGMTHNLFYSIHDNILTWFYLFINVLVSEKWQVRLRILTYK